MKLEKIGLGGGCHWCTEAIFQSLKGVHKVEQGYISSTEENSSFSEAVIVNFDPNLIPEQILIEIHLLTHRSSSEHSMRDKYRSAVYYFDKIQGRRVMDILKEIQNRSESEIITKALPFKSFESSRDAIKDYFYKNPEKPFCQNYIRPKLELLLKDFQNFVDPRKLNQPIIKTNLLEK